MSLISKRRDFGEVLAKGITSEADPETGVRGNSLDVGFIWLGSYVNEFFTQRLACKELFCCPNYILHSL